MTQLLIACETLRHEVELALSKTKVDIATRWMANGLHEKPDRLKAGLQEVIDAVEDDYDTLLFAYGSCGNGLVGLKSTKAMLVVPRFEDCIAILLANQGKLKQMRTTTYFLTPGWMAGERSLEVEYGQVVKKYGEKKTKKIYQIIFKNYQDLMLIDTSAYQVEPWMDRVNKIADQVGLDVVVGRGSVRVLEKLLRGDWDEDFCQVPPGRPTTHEDFYQVRAKKG